MGSDDGESHAGGLNEDELADEAYAAQHGRTDDTLIDERRSAVSDSASTDKSVLNANDDDSLIDSLPQTPLINSPAISDSIPDDTPTASGQSFFTPTRPLTLRQTSVARSISGPLRPLESRFRSRLSPSPSASPRVGSRAFLNSPSRQSSFSFQGASLDGDVSSTQETPWEVVRWTRLKRLATQCFSELGKRQFGSPTCLAVSQSIIIGTSKGLILVFDYHQSLKLIIGQGTIATECGSVTSLAISADHTTIAGGHATGHILTWEMARPAKPFLHIPPVPRTAPDETRNGHVPDRAVLHLGFLGTRRTAIVSADDGGMAFSHLATRGFGAVIRNVSTTRLLGRYPSSNVSTTRKPSSVLAFAALPLGNIEQATDEMGLTAIITPYLLVIVSTTPIAQTQHKVPRQKEVTPHSAVSGCLAWFPAVKLKSAQPDKTASLSKLVYCWSDVLSVIDVEVGRTPDNDKQKQPNLYFHERGRWTSSEAIVAVQWLSRSVIGVLTISQRLVIIEDGTLNAMDSVDLLQRHIYHKDLFSSQLRSVVENTESEAAIHGVVADAFHMSFRVYKGRIFLLGLSHVEVGTLSNWADRLTALVEHGDDLAAIRLAINYYTNDAGAVSIGLPEDTPARHAMVRERLLDLVVACIKYHVSDDSSRIIPTDLVPACFDACLAIPDTDLLLEDVYDMFRDANQSQPFLQELEEHVLNAEITSLPPGLVQDVVSHFVTSGQSARLEELLCRLNASTFDLDELTRLCKVYLLYDALTYVWTSAIHDWVTPVVEFLTLIRDHADDAEMAETAERVYTYLAFALTGRAYPLDDTLDDEKAALAKDQIYGFLFSDQAVSWPPGSDKSFSMIEDDTLHFPYLRALLDFDSANFMSMLNEAFEDSYLNRDPDDGSSATTSRKLTRQHIISILLDVMSADDVDPLQQTHLDIFIARCLAKFPQFIILSDSTLRELLYRLCALQQDDTLHEECQLSVEYLCSVWRPPVTSELLATLEKAGFHRVSKTLYRNEGDFVNLLRVSFKAALDGDEEAVFADLVACLQDVVPLEQRDAIREIVCEHAAMLVRLDSSQIAKIMSQYLPELIGDFTTAIDDPRLQHTFLHSLLEPTSNAESRLSPYTELTSSAITEQYIQLMCIYNPSHVADYVRILESSNLHLDAILPAIEEHGVVDAAMFLLAKDGLRSDAMSRLVKHLQQLSDAICGILAPQSHDAEVIISREGAHDVMSEIEKYVKLGIWLCRDGSAHGDGVNGNARRKSFADKRLTPTEQLWLMLVNAVVDTAKDVLTATAPDSDQIRPNHESLRNKIRSLVQQTFTAMLTSTSNTSHNTTHTSFLTIFRSFLSAASSSSSIPDFRKVLQDIFSAYAYEHQVLSLAHELLESDTVSDLIGVHEIRERGWRAKAQVCEVCKRRAWGPGIGDEVWKAWAVEDDKRRDAGRHHGLGRGQGHIHEREQKLQRETAGVGMGATGNGKGKGKQAALASSASTEQAARHMSADAQGSGSRYALVVFACRHCYHRTCLERARGSAGVSGGRLQCLACAAQVLHSASDV